MSQLDSMATRMIERLLILAAVRGTFNLVVGVFESADALVKLNTQTDISIGKLQEIKYGADVTGVTFATAATAIDQFQKKIGEAKAPTADALATIGLSFEALFNLSSDQRLDAVIKAIASLPTHLERVAAEAKLFGTDAIDPLVEKFASLSESARNNGSVMEDSVVKSLSNTAKAYREFKQSIDTIIGGLLISGSKVAEALALPLYGGGQTGREAAYRKSMGQTMFGGPDGSIPGSGAIRFGDVSLDDSSTSGGSKSTAGGPLTGQAYIDHLRQESNATKQLTDEQRSQLSVLKELNLLDAEHAVHISSNADGTQFTTDQLKEYIKTQKDGVTASKEYARSEQALQEILAKAAADKSRYEGENKATGTLQARLAAIDDEVYAEQVRAQKRVGFTKDEWQAEYAIWEAGEAKKQNLIDASAKIEEEILSKAAADRANIESRNKVSGSLEDRIAAADLEVYHEQQVAQRRLNNDEEYWRTDYAIWQTGEARKQALIDEYNKREELSEQKLHDQINAANDVSESVGLQRTLHNIDARTTAEETALDGSKIGWENYVTQLALIEEKSYAERRNATINFQRDIDKDLINLAKQDQSIIIDTYMDGMKRELAINQMRREAALELLKLKQKDTKEELDAENKLYDDAANAIKLKYDPLFQAFKDMNVDMRNEWAKTWEAALNGAESFDGAFMHTLESGMLDPFKRILAAMISDFEQILFSPMLNALKSLAGALVNSLINYASGGSGAGGGGNSAYGSLFSAGVNYGAKYALGSVFGGASAAGGSGYVSADIASVAASGGGGLGTAAATAGIYGGVGVAAWELGSLLGHQTENKYLGAGMGAAAGAGAGALAGAAFAPASMGISIGIGALVGAIAGWREAGHLWEDTKVIQADLMKQFGGIEGQIKAVGDAYALTGRTGLEAETALHRMWDAKTPEEFYAAAKPIADVLKVYQQNVKDLAADSVDSWGRISEAMERVIELNRQYGANTPQVQQFIAGQVSNVVKSTNALPGGLPLDEWDKIYNTIQTAGGDDALDPSAENNRAILRGKIDDAQKKYDDMVKKGTSTPAQVAAAKSKVEKAQEAYDNQFPDAEAATARQHQEAIRNAPELKDIGQQIVGSYALERSTPGKSPLDALRDNSAGISQLQRAYRDLGIETDDVALKSLFLQNTILTGNPNLINGIDGLGKEMTGLTNLNLENADSFAAQQRIGEQMYTRLQDAVSKAGGTTKDALEPMQEYLHAAEDASKKLNIPLDDMTQNMINQSRDAGIWHDRIKPPQSVTDAIQTLVNAVQDLIDKLSGLPPRVRDAQNATNTASGSVNNGGGGPPETDPTDPGPTPVPMAAGGYGTVDSPTNFLVGEAGPESYAFSGANQSFLPNMGGSGINAPVFTSLASATIAIASVGSNISTLVRSISSATRSNTPNVINLYSTISIQSADVQDGPRVLQLVKDDLRTDQNGLYSAVRSVAAQAVRDM